MRRAHPFWALAVSVAATAAVSVGQVRVVATPAAAVSAQPRLSVSSDGRVLLSWVEPQEKGHRLAFASLEGERWSKAKTVASGRDWFVNWADFPSVVGVGKDALFAHWLVKRAAGTYDYDVTMSYSADGGTTWSKPFLAHRDGVAAEHGFVSLLPSRRPGSVAAFWLDGREMGKDPGKRGSMTLRYAEVAGDGGLEHEVRLDPRVCECCQTSAAMTSRGPILVYRDRSEDEVRDIFCVRRVDGAWTQPRAIHEDRWKIHGCPVNGPAVAASGDKVAVAWFTAASDRARVNVAFSRDGGARFGDPVLVDGARPGGRVDVALDASGDAHVCWLATTDEGAAIRSCRVSPEGTIGDPVDVAGTTAARSSGFPQMVRAGDRLWFAWTDGRVRSAFLPLR